MKDARALLRRLGAGVSGNVVFQPLKPGIYRIRDEFHTETGQGRIVAR